DLLEYILSKGLLLLRVIEEEVEDEGDVVRLGVKLERLWCKVEACGGVCGDDLAAATLRLQGRDVASFRAKR
ncbi:hypothetical protein Tco_1104753, partial [Tanacetum coccineum]